MALLPWARAVVQTCTFLLNMRESMRKLMILQYVPALLSVWTKRKSLVINLDSLNSGDQVTRNKLCLQESVLFNDQYMYITLASISLGHDNYLRALVHMKHLCDAPFQGFFCMNPERYQRS
jgi:hypothetical protein